MKNNKSDRPGNLGAGGPKTRAGKEKSKFNALKHGGYSKAPMFKSGPLRERAELRRSLFESLAEEFVPRNMVEMNCINAAADALFRKLCTLRWEDVRIQEESARAIEPYKAIEHFIKTRRTELSLLEVDYARLESEKETGLSWDVGNEYRNMLLASSIKSFHGLDAGLKFESLSTHTERREYYLQTTKSDDRNTMEWLLDWERTMLQLGSRSLKELETKCDLLKRSGEKEMAIEKSSVLSPDEAERIMTLVSRCDRQFEKAIEFLIRYRAASRELEERESASKNRLDDHHEDAQAA